MKHVAERAGVSTSTISHVLNGTRKVSEETRLKVALAIEQLGYRPNLVARGLRTQRTFTIGVLISDVQNPFFASVVRGVEDVALRRGYHLFLCNTDESRQREEEYITELVNKGVDGLIVASSAPRHHRAERSSLERVPFIFIDREFEGIEADSVRVNNRLGMGLIAEHLVDLGHERIGMISGPLEKSSAYERYWGLKDALDELRRPLDEALVRFGDFRTSGGRSAAAELLRLPEPPTALVVANNQMTLGALLALRELEIRVPERVSVVGFDDVEWAPVADPPLTTLAQPTYEMGVQAADMLLRRVEGTSERDPDKLFLEPELIVRGSTAAPGG